MKYCNNCGKKLINGSNYCDNCGYKDKKKIKLLEMMIIGNIMY